MSEFYDSMTDLDGDLIEVESAGDSLILAALHCDDDVLTARLSPLLALQLGALLTEAACEHLANTEAVDCE